MLWNALKIAIMAMTARKHHWQRNKNAYRNKSCVIVEDARSGFASLIHELNFRSLSFVLSNDGPARHRPTKFIELGDGGSMSTRVVFRVCVAARYAKRNDPKGEGAKRMEAVQGYEKNETISAE